MLPAHDNHMGNHVKLTVGSQTESRWWGSDNYYNNTSYLETLAIRSSRDGRSGTWDGSRYRLGTNYTRYVERQTSLEKFEDEYVDGPFRRYKSGDVTYIVNQPLDVNWWEFQSINIRARARTEALNKLRGGSDLQLGADLAEINKTLAMIAKPSIAVFKALIAAKNGNWAAVPRHLGLEKKLILSGRYPANKWLEYQYGWKPLMSSAKDGYDRLRNTKDRSGTLQVRRTCADTYTIDRTINGCRVVGSADLTHRVIVDFRVRDQFADVLDSVGLSNPATIAWEVIPFSFVVDWFAPIGNVLAACHNTAGLECIQTVETGRTSARCDVTTTGFTRNGTSRHEMFIMGRSVYPDFPIPEFYFKPSPFSTSHVTSALALLRQLL